MKKIAPGVVLSLMFASLLSAQSLTELSKQEKERREALKGKRPVVITNADLGRIKKRAGIATPAPPPPAAVNANAALPTEPAAPYVAPEGEPAPTEPSPAPEAETGMPPGIADGYRPALEAKHAQAKEYADLLELKMGALWQEFYSLDDMTPRDAIQQEIALTFDKLEKAREAEKQAKKELDDYLVKGGRDNAPPIWIR